MFRHMLVNDTLDLHIRPINFSYYFYIPNLHVLSVKFSNYLKSPKMFLLLKKIYV